MRVTSWLAIVTTSWCACSGPDAVARIPALQRGSWQPASSGSTASLRGLSVVDERVVWASGSGGTVVRSVDGGASWQACGPRDAAGCDLRDVQAFDARVAVAVVAGTPARVYRTTDGGGHWDIVHEDPRPGAFFDGVAFADDRRGVLVGDPIDSRFVVLTTRDGGASWQPVPPVVLPEVLPGEAAFAASGTCVAVRDECLWLVTGGGARARLLQSPDFGASWRVVDLPLAAGKASAGAFALTVLDAARAVVVGGDYQARGDNVGTAAFTLDGGRTWQASTTGTLGYRCGVAHLPGTEVVIGVGDDATSWSDDGGRTWRLLAGPGFHATAVTAAGHILAVGSRGRIARLRVDGR